MNHSKSASFLFGAALPLGAYGGWLFDWKIIASAIAIYAFGSWLFLR